MSVFLQAARDLLAGRVARVYDLGNVPTSPGTVYLVLSVTADRPDGYDLTASHGWRWYRTTWQVFGKTLDSVEAVNDAAADALLDQRLDVPGYDCGPMSANQPGALFGALVRDPDAGGVLSMTSTVPFTATKEQP